MAQIVPEVDPAPPPGVAAVGRLDPAVFEEVQAHSADLGLEAGKQLLRRLPVTPSERVAVWWHPGLAVRTTWQVFTEYWDDFCYPFDYVAVLSASED